MKVTLNNDFYENIDIALKNTMIDLIDRVDKDEVVPYRTGTLQNDVKVYRKSKNKVSIVYSRFRDGDGKQIASYLYFHPEINFNKRNNKNAQAYWLDEYITNPKIIEDLLIKNLQQLFK